MEMEYAMPKLEPVANGLMFSGEHQPQEANW